jgi:hypothetical protein
MSNKYFLETKFVEGPQSIRTFGIPSKTPATLDLISIGIVSEDGREYYAVSKDFNLNEAWNRTGSIKDNVLKKIFLEFLEQEIKEYSCCGDENAKAPSADFNYKRLEGMISRYGKSNKQIGKEVIAFCRPNSEKAKAAEIEVMEPIDFPVFYCYFAARSWVVFCWLFRSMPEGFPSYCREIRQVIEQKAERLMDEVCFHSGNHTIWSLDRALQDIKGRPDFPIQDSSRAYSALEDAKYFEKLYTFIQKA